MRNIIKKITVVFMALVLLFSVSACGKSNIDENKIQVYVYVVSDGYGANYKLYQKKKVCYEENC